MAKLFNSNTLSREELDKIEGVAPASELPTEDQAINEAEAAEAAAGQNEIESHGDQIVDANDAIDESQEEIKKIDNALGEGGEEAASSEEVAESEAQPTEGAPVSEAEGTPNVDGSESEASPVVPGQEPVQGEEAVIAAAVATESLRQMVNKLGVPGVTCVSHEAHSDPYTSLRLAREGFKDVIEKVWRFIRELFQKIWAKLKTWTAQIIGKIKNYEKTVADLKKKLEGNNQLGADIKEEDRKSLVKLCPYGRTLADAGKFAAKEAGNQVAAAKNIVDIVKNATYATGEKAVTALKPKFGAINADMAQLYKKPDESGLYLLLRPTGASINVTFTDGKFRVSKSTQDLVDTAGKQFTKYLTKTEALAILATLEDAAKKFKADNEAILKEFENGRKAADDALAKLKEGNKNKDNLTDADKMALDNCRQASTILAIGVPEILFAKLDYFKAATTFVAKSIKAGSGDSDSKSDDKKADDKKEESKSEEKSEGDK